MDGTISPGLMRDRLGRDAFTALIRAWMARSGWSLLVVADLCEAALRHTIAAEVPDFVPGRYDEGDLVVSHNFVWRATEEMAAAKAPSKENEQNWERICGLRRLYPSQLHNLQLGSVKMPGATAFDVLGQLNLYLSALRGGTAQEPRDQRLREKAAQATVIEDADGPFGPEEMFAVFIGRLQPPFSVTQLSERAAGELSIELARKIRQGMMASGLDLLDDWKKFLAVYPTTDPKRLGKIRDVALGQGTWSPEQVQDEEAAVEIALAKLRSTTA